MVNQDQEYVENLSKYKQEKARVWFLIGWLYVLSFYIEQNLSSWAMVGLWQGYGRAMVKLGKVPYLFISFGCGDNNDSQDADELKDRAQKQPITQNAL